VKAHGREHAVDAIVFATGFDAMTGALNRIDILGRGGASLRERWSEGPRSYLGLGIAGFPNLFTITGPGSPSVLTNMLPSIEQHVDYVADILAHLRDRGLKTIEPVAGAEDEWMAHVGEAAGRTLRYTCGSWYLGVNIPGKPRVFMPYIGGFPKYVAKCTEVAAAGYAGFALGA
jgi:cyclohexanone monooxygenase